MTIDWLSLSVITIFGQPNLERTRSRKDNIKVARCGVSVSHRTSLVTFKLNTTFTISYVVLDISIHSGPTIFICYTFRSFKSAEMTSMILIQNIVFKRLRYTLFPILCFTHAGWNMFVRLGNGLYWSCKVCIWFCPNKNSSLHNCLILLFIVIYYLVINLVFLFCYLVLKQN